MGGDTLTINDVEGSLESKAMRRLQDKKLCQ